ncbi:MAG: sugar transferase [Thermomicrobiales bacterium]
MRSPWFRLALRGGQAVADAGLVWLAFWTAYQLRYVHQVGGVIRPNDFEPFSIFGGKAALFVGLTLLTFLVRGLYRLPQSIGLLDESTMVVSRVTTAMAGVILTAFLSRFVPSRLVFLYAWAIAIVLLIGRRVVTRWIRAWLWSRNVYVDRVVVVGTGDSGRRIMQEMMSTPGLGYRLIGFVDDSVRLDGMPIATEHRLQRADRLGSVADLDAIVTQNDVDEVIIALPANDHDRVLAIMDQCRERFVQFKVVPDLLQLSLDRVDLGEVAGVPLIGLRDASIRGFNYGMKRALDLAVAGVVLLLMALPMAAIALAIRLDSAGPILYRQRRIGRDGVPFSLTKFRCMAPDADERRAELLAANAHMDPRLFKLRDDPRLTRVGRALRRWSLDELPQFLQILRGTMSVVGPRPQMPEEVASYAEWHKQRLLVTPGLTGLWQINGRSRLTFDDMVRLDLYYAEHWSLWLDLKVILRTLPAVFGGHGAY